MWNGVGGGTVVYAAHWQRNMPSDFRVRTLDGVADDWPLTYEDLEPYYVRVERDLGVSGSRATPASPRRGPPMPPVPLGDDGPPRRAGPQRARLALVARARTRSPPAVRGACSPCVQRATCLVGCVDGAKASVDITYWPTPSSAARSSSRARGSSGCSWARTGLVEGAVYIDSEGAEQVQRAAVTILCRNGVGTPRLLFLSATDDHPGRARQLLGAGREAPDDAPVRHRSSGSSRTTSARQGPGASTSTRWSSTRPTRSRVRARRQVGPAAHRRAARHDPAYPWGDENAIWGEGLPRADPAAPRPLGDVGVHLRGPARGGQPGRARPRPHRRRRDPGGEDLLRDVGELAADDRVPRAAATSRSRPPAPTT